MEKMVSVRIVTVEYYMCCPVPDLDITYSEFRNLEVRQVPVIQVFGSTESGMFIIYAVFFNIKFFIFFTGRLCICFNVISTSKFNNLMFEVYHICSMAAEMMFFLFIGIRLPSFFNYNTRSMKLFLVTYLLNNIVLL